jgi:outer membrane protein FlgP
MDQRLADQQVNMKSKYLSVLGIVRSCCIATGLYNHGRSGARLVACLSVLSVLSIAAQVSAGNREVLIDATKPQGHSEAYDSRTEATQEQPMLLPVIVRVTGYGGYDAKAKNKANKRLMAIRASRLDAYRNLAERVYGFSVAGASTVKDFMLESDRFATSVDSVVRGARVVSISDNPATGIETVVELELPGDFQRCLNKVNNFKYHNDCLRPMGSMGASVPSNHSLRRSSQEPPMQALYHLN